jgi:hypothetical protein
LYFFRSAGESADSSGAGVSDFCGTLKNQIQMSTVREYATSEVTPHKKVNLVPKSEKAVVVRRETVE